MRKDKKRTAAIAPGNATGLETRHASTHFQRRCGTLTKNAWHAAWPKLTAVVDASTHLITRVRVGQGPSQDSPQFPEAMRQAAANLKPTRVLADKGYPGGTPSTTTSCADKSWASAAPPSRSTAAAPDASGPRPITDG